MYYVIVLILKMMMRGKRKKRTFFFHSIDFLDFSRFLAFRYLSLSLSLSLFLPIALPTLPFFVFKLASPSARVDAKIPLIDETFSLYYNKTR